MLDARAAATKALEYFKGLQSGAELSTILLEEVELTEDKRFWLITLGYTIQSANPFQPFTQGNREFKVFKVNADTGEVISMKIKSLK